MIGSRAVLRDSGRGLSEFIPKGLKDSAWGVLTPGSDKKTVRPEGAVEYYVIHRVPNKIRNGLSAALSGWVVDC
jgi:hypothetical protein